MSFVPTSFHRNLAYGLGITAEIAAIVSLFYVGLLHFALGVGALALSATMAPNDMLIALMFYVVFTAPTLPLFKTLWHWSRRWFFGSAVIQRSFTRTNLCAKLAVLMRNLLVIAAISTAILAAGPTEPEVRWLLAALGSLAVSLLGILIGREHQAQIQEERRSMAVHVRAWLRQKEQHQPRPDQEID